jgi:hypothetical protein
MEKIVLHSLISFLKMTAWVYFNSILPEEKGGESQFQKRREKSCPSESITLLLH